ncbi:MAG: AIR synthase family protein [Oscillospiraceae bacterium]|nr:AIR synthase family protein [Oscillospiraceae bacterium]
MRVGKISNELLDKMILGKLKRHDKRIITSAGIGEDCGVVDFGENCCIISCDPVTGATKDIGKISVNIACNDIAASGVMPLAIVVTLLIPPGFSEDDLESIVNDLVETADSLQVSVIGGHTEVTDAVTRAVISITAIGISGRGEYLTTATAVEGDSVLITKAAALEGTSIIASEFEDELASAFGKGMVEAAKKLSERVSVIREGVIARQAGAHALHDITEGGVFGAVWEMAEASGLGVEIYRDEIPVLEETARICEYYGIDPYRLISSGSLLIATDMPEKVSGELAKAGIESTWIGTFTKRNSKKFIIEKDNDNDNDNNNNNNNANGNDIGNGNDNDNADGNGDGNDNESESKGGVRSILESPEPDELYKVFRA